MIAYYNEFDPYAAEWLRNLMAVGLIPDGVVDERSIVDVSADDIRGFAVQHYFAGIGGWPLALRLAGWPDDRPVWSGSCPCFQAGTLVLTTEGYKAIESIRVGDMVLTHRSRFRAVKQIGSELAECVTVKGQGHHGLVCTPEHPFLVGDEEWCEAKDLKDRRWATVAHVPELPVPVLCPTNKGYFYDKHSKGYRVKGEKNGKLVYVGVFATTDEAALARENAIRDGLIDVRGANAIDVNSVEFARFLGYWLGDGWVSGNTVLLCGAKEDAPLLDSLFAAAKLPGKAYLERTSSRIRCGSKHLSAWLIQQFGQYAHGKKIPVWLYGMPEEYRRAFIDGYLLADGHEATQKKGGGRMRKFTTASKSVAVGVRVLLNQLGYSATINLVTNTRQAVIEGRQVTERPSFRVIAYESARSFRFLGQHGWGLVRSVEPAGIRAVYNLAVEEDESYTADGIVVHNCQDFSTAGWQKGIGAERDLWPQFARLIRECQPATVVGEQVPNAIGHGWLDRIFVEMEPEGYACGSLVLPACSVGSPILRQRMFWVARSAEYGRGACAGEGCHEAGAAERGTEAVELERCSNTVAVGGANGNGRLPGDASTEINGHGSAAGSDGIVDAVECPTGVGRHEWRAESSGRGVASGRGDGALDGPACGGTMSAEQQGHRGIAEQSSPWSDFGTTHCRDGKSRRISTERGTFPLAYGVSSRLGPLIAELERMGVDRRDVKRLKRAAREILDAARRNRAGRLKGYGNAICPQAAAVFIKCVM
jgi:intein/homing endonuclease